VKQALAPSKATAAPEFAIPVTLRQLDEMRDQVKAHVRRVNTGFLLVAAPVAFKTERRVEVMFLDRRIETQVVYCLPQEAGNFHLGLRMTHGNDEALRAEPRIPVELAAKLHLAGEDLPVTGRVVNISASGFGLDVECEVPSGELAYVELEIGFAFGEIRHCSKIGDRFRVGMKLDEFIARENEVLAARHRENRDPSQTGLARLFRKLS
jgi:PilZ domain